MAEHGSEVLRILAENIYDTEIDYDDIITFRKYRTMAAVDKSASEALAPLMAKIAMNYMSNKMNIVQHATISANYDLLVVQHATISANYGLAQGVINSQIAKIHSLTLALGVISGAVSTTANAVSDAQGIASERLPVRAPSPTPKGAVPATPYPDTPSPASPPLLAWQLPDWDWSMHFPEWDGDPRGPPTPERPNPGSPTERWWPAGARSRSRSPPATPPGL
jgi:hypothetical protein